MITMGLDASTTKTGYAIFDDKELIAYGCIKAKQKNLSWRERVGYLSEELIKIINQYKVDLVVAEDVPLMMGRNRPAKTLVMLGAVQGMIITIGNQTNIPIIYKEPSQWRSPLSLFDGTRKGTHRDQMKQKSINLANKLFNLNLRWVSSNSLKNDDDISDAILIAYSEIKQQIKGFS